METSEKVPGTVRAYGTTVNLKLKTELLSRIDARISERHPSRTQVIRDLLFWALDQKDKIDRVEAAL